MRKTTLRPPAGGTSRPPRTPTQDPWHNWQPQWAGSETTPHRTQERHAPTQAVTLRQHDKQQEQSCRRRILDARLWDSLSQEEQDAAYEIALAYESLTKGLGAGTSDWSRLPGARNPSAVANAYGRLSGGYMDWARRCQTSGVSHSMIIDILCMGISCSALDRDRRVRKGTARQNLLDGLTLYARLRGWARHPCDR